MLYEILYLSKKISKPFRLNFTVKFSTITFLCHCKVCVQCSEHQRTQLLWFNCEDVIIIIIITTKLYQSRYTSLHDHKNVLLKECNRSIQS